MHSIGGGTLWFARKMRRGYRCVNTNVLLFLRLPPTLLVRPAARDSPRARKQSTAKTIRIKLQSGSREAEPSPAVKCVKMSPSCLNSGKEATRVPALTLPLQKYRPKSVLAARNFNISPNKKLYKITLSDRRLFFRRKRNHCPNAGWQNSPTGSKS